MGVLIGRPPVPAEVITVGIDSMRLLRRPGPVADVCAPDANIAAYRYRATRTLPGEGTVSTVSGTDSERTDVRRQVREENP